jgi:hypothetical protein
LIDIVILLVLCLILPRFLLKAHRQLKDDRISHMGFLGCLGVLALCGFMGLVVPVMTYLASNLPLPSPVITIVVVGLLPNYNHSSPR